jgi:hypothetical protein
VRAIFIDLLLTGRNRRFGSMLDATARGHSPQEILPVWYSVTSLLIVL